MSGGRLRAVCAGLLAALAIAACGGDDNKGNTNLTDQQAEVLGTVAVSAVGNLASSLTHFSTPGLGGIAGGFLAPTAAARRIVFGRMGATDPKIKAALVRFRADECVPDESDQTDSDEDGVPDDDIATFTAENCTSTDTSETNLVTSRFTGTIRIQDTDDANTLFGYQVTITAFTLTITDTVSSTPDLAVQVTGAFHGDVQEGLANADQDIRTTLRINGSKAVVEHAAFAVNYDPTSGTIVLGAETLPPGELTLNGAWNWNGSYGGAQGDWGFSLTTPDPLVYDGCADDQFVFESGEIHGLITIKKSVGFVATYSGCGVAPTVTLLGTAATAR